MSKTCLETTFIKGVYKIPRNFSKKWKKLTTRMSQISILANSKFFEIPLRNDPESLEMPRKAIIKH